MGDPNTGEIYEGPLRDEGDVPLSKDEAERLRSLPLEDRIKELQQMTLAGRCPGTSDLEKILKEPTTPVFVTESGATREMPRYKCHKEVWALKIAGIKRDGEGENRETDGSAMITPAEDGFAPFRVEYDYLRKHDPQVGGYFVVYKDGYRSYSPTQAFEEGYTRI